jgi:hypothetical protein
MKKYDIIKRVINKKNNNYYHLKGEIHGYIF